MSEANIPATGSAWPRLPLDPEALHIRLLTLVSRDDDSMACNLSVHPLDAAPAYHALSYCWGEGDTSKELLCNGHTIPITQNLSDALKQIYSLGYTVLWVDAICIDQQNIEEKSHQVNQMGRIFGTAQLTWVWLGTAGSDHHIVVEYLKGITKAYREHSESYNEALDRDDMFQIQLLADKMINFKGDVSELTLKFLSQFYSLPWFSRAWIVQEFVLAKDALFIYGSAVFNVEELNDSLSVPSMSSGWYKYRGRANCERFLELWYLRERMHDKRIGIMEILSGQRATICKDERDKIFSLLSIFERLAGKEDGQIIAIKADYSTTYEEVCFAFAHDNLRGAKDLDILCNLRTSDIQRRQLPSWVLDCGTTKQRFLLGTAPLLENFQAAKGSSPMLKIEDRSLRLLGQHFDRVVAVSDYMADAASVRDLEDPSDQYFPAIAMIGNILKSRSEIFRRDGVYVTGQSSKEAFWKTLQFAIPGLHGDVSKASIINRWESREAATIDTGERIELGQSQLPMLHEATSDLSLASLIRLWNLDIPWRMGRTAGGYFCWVPWQGGVDDEIFLCAGGRTPFAMHRIGGEDPRYQILGGCYVHGIMHGEGWKPDQLQEIWID